MKVCILTSGHDAYDGRVYYRCAKPLSHIYKVTLIAPDSDEHISEDGVRIIGFPRRATDKLRNRFKPLFDLYQKAKRIDADVFHCHEPDSLIVGLLLKKRSNCSVIFDCHEFHSKLFSRRYTKVSKKLVEFIIRRLLNFLTKFCDFTVLATDVLRVDYQHLSNSKIVVLYNYPIKSMVKAELDRFNISENSPLRGDGIFRLVWVGTISPDKGLPQLIESLAILNRLGVSVHLSIIGFGDKSVLTKIEDYIIKYALNDKVAIMGRKAYKDIWETLLFSDAGILLDAPIEANKYAVSNKMYEYMAASLPVIASNLPGFKKVVERAECGELVDPLSPEGIANGIHRLYQSDYRVKGKKGNQAFTANYCWESEVIKLYDMYDSLNGIGKK
jgi:glycosyltransferase involved in cell wall biosynthesis